jgi:hypothetical protein
MLSYLDALAAETPPGPGFGWAASVRSGLASLGAPPPRLVQVLIDHPAVGGRRHRARHTAARPLPLRSG